jgi:hypothetical protein
VISADITLSFQMVVASSFIFRVLIFTRIILTSYLYPGKLVLMSTVKTYTAFKGSHRFASGSVSEVALAIRDAAENVMFLVFDDTTGRPIDVDTRGTIHEVPSTEETPSEPRGRGRPRLGVVAREVTLLPRHWDWLGSQPGGASVALRKLVDEARRVRGDRDRIRTAQEAAYHFMSAMAGNLPGFEEAARALFAYDRHRFVDLIAAWPEDLRDHALKLAFANPSSAES